MTDTSMTDFPMGHTFVTDGDPDTERYCAACKLPIGRWLANRTPCHPPGQEDDLASAQHITEVSATVDAALTREDLEGMNEAERLALVVGAAYGKALADRDQARTERDRAVEHLRSLIEMFPETSFAHSNVAVETAREFIQRIGTSAAVDSEATPAAEKD